jgi:N12 class adenine-specific DNA methylase
LLDVTKNWFSNDLIPTTVIAELENKEDNIIKELGSGTLFLEGKEAGAKQMAEDFIDMKVRNKKTNLVD